MPPRIEGAAPSLAWLAVGARIADNPRPPGSLRQRMAQYIYTMNRVGKVVPPKRHILRDISLSFFPGAKIGVLGLNGSGKSTLLRIMAGTDTDIEGEARPQPGIKVGLLPQEPQLDPAADVRGHRRGVGEAGEGCARAPRAGVRALRRAGRGFRQARRRAGPARGVARERRRPQPRTPARRRGRRAAPAAVGRQGRRSSRAANGAAWRSAGCCSRSRTCCCSTSRPTTSTRSRWRWLEQFLEQYPSTVICVTHDRYFLDNVAGWILELDRGHGIPWQGNYSSWLEQKEQRLAQEEKQQEGLRRTLARELEWVRANPKARQAKSKARLRAVRGAVVRRVPEAQRDQRDLHPAGPAARRPRDRGRQGLRKALGDRLLFDDLSFRLPQGGIVGIIGPNGAGKTTLFRMLTGHEKPDAGTIRIGPIGADRLRRPVARQARRHEDRLAGDLRRAGHHQGRQLRDAIARLCRPLQLPRQPAAAAHRRALGRRAQPRAPREGAEERRQRAAARRADQRPRRRDAARARGGAARTSPAARS